MNMAIDEAMLKLSEEQKEFYVRFYDFTNKSVILSYSDSVDNVFIKKDVEFTRRITAGKPIYIDDNVLAYSITGPTKSDVNLSTSTQVHSLFGNIIANAVKGSIKNGFKVELGKAYSIRIDGKPIAGHGQYINTEHSFLYHGIIAIGPWNSDEIKSTIRIRNEDYNELKQLPNLSELGNNDYSIKEHKLNFISNIRKEVELRFKESSDIEIKDKEEIDKSARRFYKNKYSSSGWFNRSDIQLRNDSRFCLLYEG